MTDIRVFPLGMLQTNCYLLTRGERALAVDPGGDPGPLLEFLRDRNLVLDRILNTHLTGTGRNDRNAIILLRVKNFKECERTAGRRAADALLIDLSKYIGEYFLPGDRLAHLGHACFAVFVRGVEDRDHIMALADNLLYKIVAEDGRFGRYQLEIATSVAWYPDDGRRSAELLAKARERL